MGYYYVFLGENTVLHDVDTHTHIQNDIPIRIGIAEDVWYAFVEV